MNNFGRATENQDYARYITVCLCSPLIIIIIMSVYAETTEPLAPKRSVMRKLREYLCVKNNNSYDVMSKKWWRRRDRRSDIPLYTKDEEAEKDEREYQCDSPACTVMQYSLLASCSLAVVGLIAFYSYVGYKKNTFI